MSAWDRIDEESPDFYFGRPDNSGIRGKGVDRQPYRRAGNFPYDRTDPDQMYGQPAAYDRGSNKAGGLHKPLVPKRVPRTMWKSMGLELEDKDLDEIMGSPTFLGKSASSQMGSGIPGSVGGWARNPPKAWDDETDLTKMDPKKLERLLVKLQIAKPDMTRESPLQIDTSPNPNVDLGPGDDDPISDFERRLEALGMAPDDYVGGPGGNRLTSRGLYGMMPKESSWDVLSGKRLIGRDPST